MKSWIGLSVLVLLPFLSKGQLNVSGPEVKLTKWFDQKVGIEQTPLYYGPIYLMVSKSRYTHQFFETKLWQPGHVRLGEHTFYDILMVFDVEQELLVLKHPDLTRRDGVALDMQRVHSFEIGGHYFSRIAGNNGFYDVLLQGTYFNLVCRRRKVEQAEASGTVLKTRDVYYILHGGQLIRLANKKSLELVHPESKRLSKEITKAHRVKFKVTDEEQLIQFLKHFDHAFGS